MSNVSFLDHFAVIFPYSFLKAALGRHPTVETHVSVVPRDILGNHIISIMHALGSKHMD